jgi:predicted RNA-binding protein with PIN domain
MIYIIDGYNVMHAIEDGLGIQAEDLEEKRQLFVESVVSLTAVSGDRAIIVFDSTVAENPEMNQLPGTSVSVWFSSRSESADILIGKLVQKELKGTRERVRVVSADWEVQKGAMQSRVERIPPRHFIADIKKFEIGLAKSPKMGRIRWKLEHKLDVETLKKLEEMRRGRQQKKD